MIYPALMIFAYFYNRRVAEIEAKKGKHAQAIVGVLVAIGVAVTVIPLGVLSPEWMLITMGAFVMSGIPMLHGSVSRYLAQRAADDQREAEERQRIIKLMRDAD